MAKNIIHIPLKRKIKKHLFGKKKKAEWSFSEKVCSQQILVSDLNSFLIYLITDIHRNAIKTP